jgi:hypothetical protein
MRKFELTDHTLQLAGVGVLYRIRALIDIPRHGVKAGDMGGWVEREDNLSHEGEAWISDIACVFDNALIAGNALVSGKAHVYGNVQIAGRAHVYGRAIVFGNVQIAGSARLSGFAVVSS